MTSNPLADLPLNEKGEPVDWAHATAVIERLTDRNDVLAADLALMEAERDRLAKRVEELERERTARS